LPSWPCRLAPRAAAASFKEGLGQEANPKESPTERAHHQARASKRSAIGPASSAGLRIRSSGPATPTPTPRTNRFVSLPLGRPLSVALSCSLAFLGTAGAKVGRRRAAELRRILGPRILQRSKDSLATRPEAADQAAANAPDDDASTASASAPGASSSSSSSSSGCPSLPPKHEVVLWVGLSAQQRRAYEQYLKGNAVQKV